MDKTVFQSNGSRGAPGTQVRAGQAALGMWCSVFQARQKLPGTYWNVWASQSLGSHTSAPLETGQRKLYRGAYHLSSSSCGRGRCQSAGGLCLGVHTRVCLRAAWTLLRSLSQRDRCARETLVISHPTCPCTSLLISHLPNADKQNV